jgi:hypothetical protein
VGIGTTSPFNTTNNTGLNVDTGGHSSIMIGDGINDGGMIQSSDSSQRIIIGANVYDDPSSSWQRWNGTGAALIDVYGQGGAAFISLNVDNGSSGFPSAKLFVKGDGNVGIGTTSPVGRLSIVSSGGTDGLRITAGTGSSNNGLVVNNEADNATLFYVRGNGDSAVGGNFTVNNKFYQNSVGRICNSGFTNGNSSFYIDYTVASQSSLKVTAVMNHYGYITSYGCSRFSLVGIGPVITTVDISTVATGNGGSWGISRINASTLRVTKNAGTYPGGGYWFIEITGNYIS